LAVGRFQVMATLHAARAIELGLPEESAKSWGLNRAIFYAAAKRGFKGAGEAGMPARGVGEEVPGEYRVGGEIGFVRQGDPTPLFAIGGKVQTEQDFERQIASRFNGKFEAVWEEALDYVRHFDRQTLASGESFFREVYRVKRDEFAAKWTAMAGSAPETAARSPRKRRQPLNLI